MGIKTQVDPDGKICSIDVDIRRKGVNTDISFRDGFPFEQQQSKPSGATACIFQSIPTRRKGKYVVNEVSFLSSSPEKPLKLTGIQHGRESAVVSPYRSDGHYHAGRLTGEVLGNGGWWVDPCQLFFDAEALKSELAWCLPSGNNQARLIFDATKMSLIQKQPKDNYECIKPRDIRLGRRNGERHEEYERAKHDGKGAPTSSHEVYSYA